MLRVDQVIGARGADLAHLRRANRRGECDGLRAAVDLEYDAVRVSEERAAEHGKGPHEEGFGIAFPGLRDLCAAEAESAVCRAVERAGGARYKLDRASVALIRRLAPRHEPVLLKQDRSRGRIRLEQFRDALGHVESRPLVVEPDHLVAECFFGEAAAVRRRRERDDRVRVRVVDVRRRDERV